MRTLEDLAGAFALLDEDADRFAATSAESAVAPAPVHELTIATGTPRRRASRFVAVAVGMTAAAAASAVALTLAVSGTTSTHPPAAGGRDELRTVGVQMDPTLGLQITDTATYPGGYSLFYAGRGENVTVDVLPARIHVSKGLAPVEVSGVTGYYGTGSRPVLAGDPSIVELTAFGRAPGGTSRQPAVIWPTADGRWAEVTVQGRVAGKADLLRLARGVHFNAPRPVRIPLGLRRAPSGLHLEGVAVTYHYLVGSPRRERVPGAFLSAAYYLHRNPRDGGIVVQVSSAGQSLAWTGGEPVKVGTHRGYWFPDREELAVDLGHGAIGSVQAWGTTGLPPSRGELVAIGATLYVAAEPADRSTWLPATTALP